MIGTGGFLVLAASFSTLAPAALCRSAVVGACAGTSYVTGFTVLQENVQRRAARPHLRHALHRRPAVPAHLARPSRRCGPTSGTGSPTSLFDRPGGRRSGRTTTRSRGAHRALGRRAHHARRRVRGLAVDPQGGAARGREPARRRRTQRGSARADPSARADRAVAGGRADRARAPRPTLPSRRRRGRPKPGRRRDPRPVRGARGWRRQRQEHAGGAAGGAGCAAQGARGGETFEPGAGADRRGDPRAAAPRRRVRSSPTPRRCSWPPTAPSTSPR